MPGITIVLGGKPKKGPPDKAGGGSYGPKEEDSEEPMSETGSMASEARMAAAEAAIEAVNGGDATALDRALHAHYKACAAGGDE